MCVLLAFACFSHVQVTFHYISVRAVLVPYSECTYIYIWLILNLFFLVLRLQAPVPVLKTAYCKKLATKSSTNPDWLKLSWAKAVLAWSNGTLLLVFKNNNYMGIWEWAVLKNDLIRNDYQMGPHLLQFCYKFTRKWFSTWYSTQTWKHLIFVFPDLLLAIPLLFPAGGQMLLACLACSLCCHCLSFGGGQELHLKCTEIGICVLVIFWIELLLVNDKGRSLFAWRFCLIVVYADD